MGIRLTKHEVIINTWKGDKYENDNECHCCGEFASTVTICWSKFCAECLNEGLKALKQARLEGVSK